MVPVDKATVEKYIEGGIAEGYAFGDITQHPPHAR